MICNTGMLSELEWNYIRLKGANTTSATDRRIGQERYSTLNAIF